MHVEIGAEAALFPEKEYISGIFVAVNLFHILYFSSENFMSTYSYLFYDYFIIFPKNTAEGFIPFQSYCLVDEYLVYLQGQDRCASMHTA